MLGSFSHLVVRLLLEAAFLGFRWPSGAAPTSLWKVSQQRAGGSLAHSRRDLEVLFATPKGFQHTHGMDRSIGWLARRGELCPVWGVPRCPLTRTRKMRKAKPRPRLLQCFKSRFVSSFLQVRRRGDACNTRCRNAAGGGGGGMGDWGVGVGVGDWGGGGVRECLSRECTIDLVQVQRPSAAPVALATILSDGWRPREFGGCICLLLFGWGWKTSICLCCLYLVEEDLYFPYLGGKPLSSVGFSQKNRYVLEERGAEDNRGRRRRKARKQEGRVPEG